MNVAISLYKYFVGNGNGLVYLFIYIFLGVYLGLYLFKMFIPSDWLGFMGFSGGGEMWENKADGWSVIENVLKPCFRAILAGVVLLQIKPVYVTEWLVNPFLEFGSIYTNSILQTINNADIDVSNAPVCPVSIKESGWISEKSCDFLIQPVYTISKENNRVIAYGFSFLSQGFAQLSILSVGKSLLNIITGVLLIASFVSSNLFMALLIIQGIFDFCFALIMYPFKVLTWVAKKSDKWFDVLPAFDQIITALKKLVITMIACAFILCINVALVRALFDFSVIDGSTTANTAEGFGNQSLLWISSILTFFLMYAIFKMTRERLNLYSGVSSDLYNNVTATSKRAFEKIKKSPETVKTIVKKAKERLPSKKSTSSET